MAYFVVRLNMRIVAPDVRIQRNWNHLIWTSLREVMIFLVCVSAVGPFLGRVGVVSGYFLGL